MASAAALAAAASGKGKKVSWLKHVAPFLEKSGLVVGILICFVWSQVAGWSVTGTMLADHAAQRAVAATGSETKAAKLQQYRDERNKIGTPRTQGQVEADLDLELRRTSKSFPKGDGPAATKLRGELDTVKRAAELDGLIATALAEYQDAPAVAAGDVDTTIPVGIGKRIGWVNAGADEHAKAVAEKAAADDVHFWFVVFFVGATGFLATFGFRLVGIRHDEIGWDLLQRKPIVYVLLTFLIVEAGMNAMFGYRRAGGGFLNLAGLLQGSMFAGVAILGAYLPTCWRDHAAAPAPSAHPFLDAYDFGPPRISSEYASRTPSNDYAPNPLPGPMHPRMQAPDYWPPRPGLRSPHSEDTTPLQPQQQPNVTINFAQAPGGEIPTSPAWPKLPAPGDSKAASGAQTQEAALPPLEMGPPVDRSAAQGRQDHLLVFKQACLVSSPGSRVSADDMFARYAHWAGRRALTRNAFLALLSELADVPEQVIAGEQFFVDVDVRTGVALQEVVRA